MQARQGDVLVESVTSIPEVTSCDPADGKFIVAHGEATGHNHSLESRYAKMYRDAAGILYLLLVREHILRHEEHDPVTLPPGKYRVTRQREYSPEEIRHVQD